MGWNTTVLFLNDAVDNLTNDPDFGTRLYRAINRTGMRHSFRRDGQQDLSVGNHANGCTVIEKHHADQVALVAVGGNHATKVFLTHSIGNHHTEEGQEALLRAWADTMGFHLTKKRKK
jgi:hypothetical protein